MSEGDRSERLALVIVVCTIFVFIIGLWAGGHYSEQHRNSQQRAAAEEIDTTDISGFWLKHSPMTGGYEAVCDHPSDKDQADLCQQWRSATAAEEMVFFSALGVGLSFAGVSGLIWTIIISNRATKAAIAANDLNRETLYATTRPYLDIKVVKLTQYSSPDNENNWWVDVHVLNASQFRAIDVSCKVAVRPRPLTVLGNDGVAHFSQAFMQESRARGSVLIPSGGEAKLHDLGEDDLPPTGRIGGRTVTVSVRYRSNVNPSFYYVGAMYHLSGEEEFEPQGDGSYETVAFGHLVPESHAAT